MKKDLKNQIQELIQSMEIEGQVMIALDGKQASINSNYGLIDINGNDVLLTRCLRLLIDSNTDKLLRVNARQYLRFLMQKIEKRGLS